MARPHDPRLSDLTNNEIDVAYAWPEGHHLRLNMLVTPEGLTVGSDATSDSLTTTQDRRLLRAIRAPAHTVILGGASIRAEGWHLPPQGTLAVFTASSNLPWETCPDRTRVITIPTPEALAHFISESKGAVLCEGGLTLARLIEQRIGFDSVALTTIGSLPTDPALLLGSNARFTQQFVAHEESPASTFTLWRRAAS